MEQWEAPAAVEACLLAKFRERTVAAQEEEAVSPVVVQMPQRASGWHRWYPQAVAAAVLLMFAIGGASMLRVRDGERPAAQSNRAVASNSNKAESQAMAVSPDTTPARVDEEDTATPAPVENADNAGRGQKLSPGELAAIYGTASARRTDYQNKSRVNEAVKTSTNREIATDFMPVSYGDNLNEIDNGRIVRVEMPRSALAQFGIPVNMDRANERIKADVLIGDDGMARAIRFVR
jgi:cytoskeletal protein RodZ